MVRATLLLSLTVVGLASAAPADWSAPTLPPDWKDISETAMKEQSMIDQRDRVITAGGTFEATMYAGETGGMLVVRSDFGGATSTMAELNGFMTGFRNSGKQTATERGWDVDRTPNWLVSIQRLDRQGDQATTKSFAGYTTDDKLRTIAFFCYGTDAVCDSVLGKVTVDSTGLQLLGDLDANKKKLTPYRIGWIVGSVGTLIFVLVALWKRRPRAPK